MNCRSLRPAAPLAIAVLLCTLAPRPASAEPPSFQEVVAALSSPKADERVNALRLLRDTGYPEAEVPVAKLLSDPVPAVRLAAIATEMNCFLREPLTGRSHVAFVIEVRNPVGAKGAFDEGLMALRPQPVAGPVLEGFLVAAGDRDPRVAREALYGLGVIAPMLAGPEREAALARIARRIVPALRNMDPATRLAALEVAGRAFRRYTVAPPADTALGDAIITEMNDGAADVRAAAVQALGDMRDERALQALTDRFQYFRTRGDREAAPTLEALARIGHATSLPLFEQLASDANPAIRAAAVEGIARAGDLEAVNGVLHRLQGDRDGRVTLALNFAVARAGGPVSLDTFIIALSNAALAPRAEADLAELTATGRTTADQWREALQTQDLENRLHLATILGLSGDTSLAPALRQLLNDADARIADTARLSMARLQTVPARTPARQ